MAMARHAQALRLWRNTCTSLCPQLRGSHNLSSLVGDATCTSCKTPTSTFRAFSSLQSIGQLGLSREIMLDVSRDAFSNGFEHQGGLRMALSWPSGGFRHASTATSENSKPEGITLTDNCIRRIQEIKLEDGPEGENKMLRLSVEGGGCSGFMYNFALDDRVNKDDRVFERDGAKLVVDDISFGFIKGATVDFTEELIRASFAVTINPNAASACGCGASFNAR